MRTSGPLLTRLGSADVLSWNPVDEAEGDSGVRLVGNFGDLLGPLLAEAIVGIDAVDEDPVDPAKVPVLLAVGSVLHFAPRGAIVWGSGVNFKLGAKLPRSAESLDVRAVRGPYTARALTAAGARVPVVYGDPALLLPRYMPELIQWREQGDGGLLVVPNLNDYREAYAHGSPSSRDILDPTRPLRNVLRRIARSSFVVGSSLHAIVIADALGIPARLISSRAEGAWKYRDYLAGTGRPFTRIARDVDEALAWGGHARPEVDLDALLAAFPVDLWSGGQPVAAARHMKMSDQVTDAWRALLHIPLVEPAVTARRLADELIPVATSSDVPDMRTLQGLLAEIPDPDLARQMWLNAVGAHALLVSVRGSAGKYLISCVLRTGSLQNQLEEISLVVEDTCGGRSSFDVPIFPMYRKQWSVDVSAPVSLAPGAVPESIVIFYRDGGDAHVVPVVRDGGIPTDLWSYPEKLASGGLVTARAVREAVSEIEEA